MKEMESHKYHERSPILGTFPPFITNIYVATNNIPYVLTSTSISGKNWVLRINNKPH